MKNNSQMITARQGNRIMILEIFSAAAMFLPQIALQKSYHSGIVVVVMASVMAGIYLWIVDHAARGVSIENVLKTDAPEIKYRNKFLAQAMINLNLIDTIGSGIVKMFTIQSKKYFPLPEYELSNDSVKVTIEGKVLDMNYALKLASIPNLTLQEIILLDKVQKGHDINTEEVKTLKGKNLIEGKRPNIHISSNVAKVTDQKDEYIKMQGIDDEHYQALMIKYLLKFEKAKKADFEKLLLDKLPNILDEKQKKNKIKNILQKLRLNGEIETIGYDWILSKTKKV